MRPQLPYDKLRALFSFNHLTLLFDPAPSAPRGLQSLGLCVVHAIIAYAWQHEVFARDGIRSLEHFLRQSVAVYKFMSDALPSTQCNSLVPSSSQSSALNGCYQVGQLTHDNSTRLCSQQAVNNLNDSFSTDRVKPSSTISQKVICFELIVSGREGANDCLSPARPRPT